MHEPRNASQKPEKLHLRVHCADGEVLCSVVQLLEVLAECDDSHHVERVVECPVGDLDTLPLMSLKLLCEGFDFFLDVGVVVG